MGPYLELWIGAHREQVSLPTDRPFVIGRHPTNDLVIEEPSVSRLHATIEAVGEGWLLSDASSAGTVVNGTRIVGRHIALSAGATIEIGTTSIVLKGPTGTTVSDETLLPAVGNPEVTKAERRVLLALCRPLVGDGPVHQPATVAEIATELTTSAETVKFHLRNLYTKFGIPQAGTTRRALLADTAVRARVVNLSDLR